MTLKIFVSSVYHELYEERQALSEEIRKLQDLFVGMEFFGSDPSKPADYCVRVAEQSDLYVGVIGGDYGSVDESTSRSFTQLEYEAAIGQNVPCLVYFKANAPDDVSAADPRLTALKDRLRQRHIVYTFRDSADLKLQFLIDFIKLLRRELFDKIIPIAQGAIPADALLSLTRGCIREQIRSVGHDKYISELYVSRAAEKEVAGFTDFEHLFRARAEEIFRQLAWASAQYGLGGDAELAVSRARLALDDARGETLPAATDGLKRAFYFDEVERVVNVINSLIMEPSEGRFYEGAEQLRSQLRGLPFVNQTQLAQVPREIFLERARSLRARALQTDTPYKQLLQLFPSFIENETAGFIYLVNDLIKELTRLFGQSTRRCFVLVDRAGTGKTNVACRLAEQLINEHPVVLLSGQMELSSEYDIEFHVQRQLESAFRGIFTDWTNRVSDELGRAHKWLFIIIDGINENANPRLLLKLLKGLLPRLESKRIKLILTCRDLFWDLCRDPLGPYLFAEAVPLHEFSEAEWHSAVKAYFDRFDIQCELDRGAREALRNPLLLRFFCEAHEGMRLGRVSDLRLLSVFDLYVKRAAQNISERHALMRPRAVLTLLLDVARKMWEHRSVGVEPSLAGVGPQEADDNTSIYNLVLSENLILEEAKLTYSTRTAVRFLYDEFMEYMIARSWADDIAGNASPQDTTGRLLQEAAESVGSFPPTLGSVLFLDKMLGREGHLVSEFITRISKLGDLFQHSQQTSIVYAFENINFDHVEDELINVLEWFEPTLRDDLKERVASVVLKILKARPDHRFARRYVHQVLEVEPAPVTAVAGAAPTSESAVPRDTREPAPAGMTVYEARRQGLKHAAENRPRPRLPPGRYHYAEETKINAIGLLVQLRDDGDYEVIEEGIRKLGRMYLHSALTAMQHLDLASDETVYKAVAEYIEIRQPEYRIYCAWLLRERYGLKPAAFLARLLTDAETRVHQYAFTLFGRRLVERELIEEVLRRLDGAQQSDIKPWHLTHFVRLLGRRESFRPPESADAYGTLVVAGLSSLLKHRHASLRLEVYRALALYPSLVSLDSIRQGMRQDVDAYVRLQADRLGAGG
ncbi:MAG: hypothetical protein QOH49_1203 [Acidobacteriota bacterium]|jgi:hypothetical protein|nr:hypothetical protein [Acidobacteriota bacterium]